MGLLGEPSGKFDYYVLYLDLLPSEPIIPTGWDDMPEEVQMEDIDMIEWDDLMGDTNEIDDIWASDEEVDHMTRGGRHFKPPHLESDNPLGELDKRFDVQEEEDEVLRQLKKTNANITIWGLLMASHKHRQTVLKLLNQIQVPVDLSPEGLVNLVNPTPKNSNIVFTEADLPKSGPSHSQALHITVDTMGKRVPTVLIDNGSALNVCPLRTATVLGLGPADFTPSGQTVRAYDNTRREVIGVVTLPLIMGPTEFRVEFQVLDVPSCFNLLLGRPWIHPAGAVPSSLHQKVKFPYDGAIVTLQGDYDLKMAGVPVCEIKPESVEIPLSGFEYVQCIEKELEKDEPSWHCTFYLSSDPALADKDFSDKYFTEGPNPQSMTSWYNSMGSKKEEDWVEHMDSETMVALFQDMVLTLGESAVEDCQDSSVHHATMPLHNWYLEDGAIAEILEEEDHDLPDSSL